MIKKFAFLSILLVFLAPTVLANTIEWACGECGSETTGYFDYVTDLKDNCFAGSMNNILDANTCLHVTGSDAKWDVNWTSWTSGAGGGFAYIRSDGGTVTEFTHSDGGDEKDSLETDVCVDRGDSGSVYNSCLQMATLNADTTSGSAPLSVTFTGECVNENPKADLIECTIDFGDTVVVDFNSVSGAHVYGSAGTYNALLNAENTAGETGDAPETITVTGGNKDPTASLTANPTTGTEPLDAEFTASCSDTDGTIQSCALNFNDGNSYTFPNAAGGTIWHRYETANAYSPYLTATDDQNATDMASETITVNALGTGSAPVITNQDPADQALAGIARPTVSFDITDVDNDVNIDSLVVNIDGEDRNVDVSGSGGNYSVSWAFDYDLADTYIVYTTASVSDSEGNDSGDVEWEFSISLSAPSNTSVSINGGDSYTDEEDVTLSLGATDADECRFMNDGGSWSAWEAFNGTKSWSLRDQDGTRTVYYQCRGVSGAESSNVTDDIILDREGPEQIDYFRASYDSDDDEVLLEWDIPDDVGEAGVDNYCIFRGETDDFDDMDQITCGVDYDEGEYTDTANLEDDETYYYVIVAHDNAGNEGEESDDASVLIDKDGSGNNSNNNNNSTVDTSAPFLQWESPLNNDNVSGMVMLKVWSYDDETVLKPIKFYVDNKPTPVGTDGTPVSNRYVIDWNSETVADGTHTLKAVSQNYSGQAGRDTRERTITVTTSNGIESVPNGEQAAQDAIDRADGAMAIAQDLREALEAIGVEPSQDSLDLFDEAVGLLDDALDQFDGEEYHDAETAAVEAGEKFDEFVDLVSVSDFGEELECVYNREHLGILLRGFGFSEETCAEAETLAESFEADRVISIKKIEEGEETYYRVLVKISVKNDSEEAKEITVMEVVPKEFAENASDLAAEGATVIVDDPILEWRVLVEAGQEAEIVYSLKEDLDEESVTAFTETDVSEKFAVPPVVLAGDTILDAENLLLDAANASPAGFFGLGSLAVYAPWALLLVVLVVVAVFLVGRYSGGGESFGLAAASGKRPGEGLFERIGSLGKREEGPKKPKWAYRE